MDKRAFLAFVLSLVILIAWSLWFAPPSPPPPPKEEAPPAGKEQKKEEEPVKGALEAIPLQPSAQATAEPVLAPIIVETPLYAAKLSPKGGVLLEWKLKHYWESLSSDSPLVEMVSLPKEDVRPLQLRVDDRVDSFINSATYRFDRDEVHLDNEGTRGTLRATLSSAAGLTVTKQFTFYADSYLVDLEVSVCDSGGRPLKGEVGLIWPHLFTDSSSTSTYSGPIALTGNRLEEVSDFKEFNKKEADVQWAGFALRYFVSAVVPVNEGKKSSQFQKSDGATIMTVTQGMREASSCQSLYKLYLGPKTMEDLKKAEFALDRALDFGFFDIIARPLLVFMKAIDGYTHNYGIAIIILTIVIKLLFWPLTHKSYVSMKEMQRIQPRIKQIRERFQNDKEQLNREMMLLYRTHKVNPLGGCLPMVLQIPVFFALYKALMDSIELRHAPFIFWVKDLAAPDYLLRFPAGVNIFGIEGIGPLPLLMGLSMVIQQKMTPTMGDPMQAKVMMLMPIFFTFLFISFPSGLVLYWLTNNILSIVQQIYINARVE